AAASVMVAAREENHCPASATVDRIPMITVCEYAAVVTAELTAASASGWGRGEDSRVVAWTSLIRSSRKTLQSRRTRSQAKRYQCAPRTMSWTGSTRRLSVGLPVSGGATGWRPRGAAVGERGEERPRGRRSGTV